MTTEIGEEAIPFLCGAIRGGGEISFTKNGFSLSFIHSDKAFIELLCQVIQKISGFSPEIEVHYMDNGSQYETFVPAEKACDILEKCCIVRNRYEPVQGIPDSLFQNGSDSRRVFLRGLFLSCGSLRLPDEITEWDNKKTKSRYRLSFLLNSDLIKEDVMKVISQEADIDEKTVRNHRGTGVFLLNSQSICNVLTAIGSNEGVLRIYDIMTERRVKNDVNRAQNLDMANIGKTVRSAFQQIAAIQKIEQRIGLDNLPEPLRKTCQFRLQNREAGLEEIAAMFQPPVTKSCINHRMRRIMELASQDE